MLIQSQREGGKGLRVRTFSSGFMSGTWSSMGSHSPSLKCSKTNHACALQRKHGGTVNEYHLSMFWKTSGREQLEKKDQLGWEHHLGEHVRG